MIKIFILACLLCQFAQVSYCSDEKIEPCNEKTEEVDACHSPTSSTTTTTPTTNAEAIESETEIAEVKAKDEKETSLPEAVHWNGYGIEHAIYGPWNNGYGLERNAIYGPRTGNKHPRVALSMIVKNERNVIERCLESVLPIIDTWQIVDTGSTDGT